MRVPPGGWHVTRPPSIAEIDRALAQWNTRIQQVDENLLALETLDVVQRLQGQGYYPPLTLEGLTKTRVEPALATLGEIFAQRTAIADMLDTAREMRQSLNTRWPSERTLSEIGALLFGPSVLLSATKTPLARRGLLTASLNEQRLPPDEVLVRMTQAYDAARDTILAVEHAWDTLDPTIEAAMQEVQTLEHMAQALGTAADAELLPIRLRLSTARQRVERDPLGTEVGLMDALVPVLRDVRERLAALLVQKMADQTVARRARDDAEAAILRARALLDTLHGEQAEAYTRYLRCQAEIAPPNNATPPPAEATLADLSEWLRTLERTATEKRWLAVSIGAQRWEATAQSALATIRAARETCDAPLAARDELLGRLIARRQQVQAAMRRGVAVDPMLERDAFEAETLLRRRPTPLREAEAQMARYEQRLRNVLHHP